MFGSNTAMREGLKNGKAVYRCEEYTYDGYWFNGEKTGQGTIEYKDCSSYEGEWNYDLKNGEGIFMYNYGGTYKGEFLDDKKHGHGVEELSNGFIYTGNYENDIFNGKGNLAAKDSSYIYLGDFKDGRIHGIGQETVEDGIYEGQFKEGVRHGSGKFYTTHGYKYTGGWKFGVKEGYGVEYLQSPDNMSVPNVNKTEDVLSTTMRDNSVNANMADGFIYEGEFCNGRKYGIGKKILKNGNYYYGRFENDRLHGLIYEFNFESSDSTFSYYQNGVKEKDVRKDDHMIPIISGYNDTFTNFVKKKVLYYEDNEFGKNSNHYYQLVADESKSQARTHIDVTKINFLD